MGLQVLGATSANVLEVDATMKAARMSLRPAEVINWNSIGGNSGLATVIAAAGPVFSFRNTGANLLMVRRIAVGFSVTTAFTAAQTLRYDLTKVTGFTLPDSGGTALYVAGANKHRSSFASITSAPDIRIATTAALTAGTRTLEASPMGVVLGGVGALGTAIPVATLLQHDAGDYPMILAQNEGFIIANSIAMGAAGVGNISVVVEYAEVATY